MTRPPGVSTKRSATSVIGIARTLGTWRGPVQDHRPAAFRVKSRELFSNRCRGEPAVRPSLAIFSVRMTLRCCDFSLPASRTAKRSSTILEGMPAGLAIDFDAVTAELRRRQGGYGRGRRMAIESDRAEAAERRPARRDHRRADRADDSEQGLGELAAHDARRARRSRTAPRARSGRRSRGRGPATPIWPAS